MLLPTVSLGFFYLLVAEEGKFLPKRSSNSSEQGFNIIIDISREKLKGRDIIDMGKKIKKVLFLFILAVGFCLTGCNSSLPQRNFVDANLLIDLNVMPQNWGIAEYNEDNRDVDSKNQVSGAYITFYAKSVPYFARASEHVYRYRSSNESSKYYKKFMKRYFNDKSVYRTSKWITPTELSFTSISAKQWHYACAGSNFFISPNSQSSQLCIYLAQYNEYVVFFTITTQEDSSIFITLLDVESVIRAIDQKMNILWNEERSR